jgi:hypothetical protein
MAGVHTLRHAAAVAWLEAGVQIKAVADLLGHSSISVTDDTYGAHLGRHGTGRSRGFERSAGAVTHDDAKSDPNRHQPFADSERAFDARCATYPHQVRGTAVPDDSKTALTCKNLGRADRI